MCPKKLTYLIIFFKSFALALKISDWAVKSAIFQGNFFIISGSFFLKNTKNTNSIVSCSTRHITALLVYNDFGANSSVVAISAPGSGKLRSPFEKYEKASYSQSFLSRPFSYKNCFNRDMKAYVKLKTLETVQDFFLQVGHKITCQYIIIHFMISCHLQTYPNLLKDFSVCIENQQNLFFFEKYQTWRPTLFSKKGPKIVHGL